MKHTIQEAWKLAGAKDGEKPPGLNMSALLEIGEHNNKEGLQSTLSNWLLIFDQCGAWFANLSVLLIFLLKVDSDENTIRHKILSCLIGNIVAQIMSIRQLVTIGLDVQAKQLLRVLVENLDVALLISRNDEALLEFDRTVDEYSSNLFWHKYVSKGKIRDKVHSKLRQDIGPPPIGNLRNILSKKRAFWEWPSIPVWVPHRWLCSPASLTEIPKVHLR
ncbi:hypothetical protein [Roseococcus sp. SYP-B2431]|uniref:hypothetical protein n=1 Tax=Roseococcus sp. SYP-B2431 TaxID=2496640 RepID=UPI0013F44BFC|nr:hypothetical protein [Roseococcus sp. SYP-B2431]